MLQNNGILSKEDNITESLSNVFSRNDKQS
jgi:hypothetical protein